MSWLILAQHKIVVPEMPDGMKEAGEPGMITYVAVIAMLVVAFLFSGLVIYFLKHLSRKDAQMLEMHKQCEDTITAVAAKHEQGLDKVASRLDEGQKQLSEIFNRILDCRD